MSELPSGTVTFLFTDIEGSTQLVKRLGALYGELLAQHQRLIRKAAAERGGHEIDTQGDSFFFAFPRANAALGAAVVAQRALATHDWPEGAEVRVRMGLHTGEPVVGDERYVGIGVHRAARIGAIGHGGQVLLSNATRELVDDEVDGVSIRDLGSYRLKDIDRAERLYQLEVTGLRSTFPPLRAERVREPSRISRRTILVAALAGVLAAAVAIPIFAFGQGGSSGDSVETVAGNSVGYIDAESNELVADISVGTTPTDVVAAEGAVWVTNTADDSVDRIDPATRTVRQTIPVENGPVGIAYGDGSVWVANSGSGSVSRIDPDSNTVTDTIAVGNGPAGLAFGGGALWVANRDAHTVSEIDPAAGKVTRNVTVGLEPLDVAVGPEGIWITSSEGRAVRIDPAAGNVADTVGVGRRPAGIAVGSGSVWVANSLDGTVSRIDPQTSAVSATIETGQGPAGIAVGFGSVWVANEQDGTVTRIDAATNEVDESIAVGGNPVGVAVVPDGVFLAVRPGGGAHRGGTLTVVTAEADLGTLDPAVAYTTISGYGLTNDGLTTWKRVGGQEGAQIVPNLAVAIPQPTNGGRTYTFRLRKGIRYSTGRPLRAADFRRAFERVFVLNAFDAAFYSAIRGADACRREQACDLSGSIVTDDRTGTVTFHLTRPDPDFPAKLSFPLVVAVPSDTPIRDFGRRPLPATGPYMIAGSVPGKQVRLVRNPKFRVWSPAVRPDGYPDEIVFKLNVPLREQIAAVASGQADIADLSISGSAEIARLRTRFGSRLHSDPGPFVVFTFLNSRVPPFDDVRVRRALNLAVDRDAIVRTLGGDTRASPTCQILPANYSGYEPYCPYERDLDEARRLVSASGTRGQEIVILTRASYASFFAHVVRALRDLGYRPRLKTVDDVEYYSELGKAGPNGLHAGYLGWAAAIPSPAEYVQSLLGLLTDIAGYSDAEIGREIDRALDLQQRDLVAANDVWSRVDRMLVDRAYLVPLYNGRGVAFVSDRVGNYQLHLFFYYLLDQLWVR